MIDPRDVPRRPPRSVLSSAGHEGQTYLLTGPDAITYAQVAAELSAATASKVEFIDVPDDDARLAMIGNGLPGFVAEQLVRVSPSCGRRADARVTPTVEALTGSAPSRLRLLCRRDRAGRFAPATVTAQR